MSELIAIESNVGVELRVYHIFAWKRYEASGGMFDYQGSIVCQLSEIPVKMLSVLPRYKPTYDGYWDCYDFIHVVSVENNVMKKVASYTENGSWDGKVYHTQFVLDTD